MTGHSSLPPHPLTPDEVAASRAAHGSNLLSRRKKPSFARRFLANLGDPVIRILLCALGVNLLLAFRGTDWFETGGIALAVFLAALISTLSEYGSEAAFERLSEACARTVCRVRRAEVPAGVRAKGAERTSDRAGVVCEVPVGDVVRGDLVRLGAGDAVPADGLLLSGRLTVDQSAMTGESREAEKQPSGRPSELLRAASAGGTGEIPLSPSDPDALFRGCTVLSGQGELLVTAVGDATFLGHISDEVQTDTRESPLKLRLSRLADQISRLGYVAAALVAVVFLLNAFLSGSGFETSVILSRLSDWRFVWDTLFHAATLGLTVLVVAVPEGLPMMIAVVLSANIRRMVRDQVLVRKPVGIEAAGSMDLLFTDKTGTLTEGRLSVGGILTGSGRTFSGVAALSSGAPALLPHLTDACMVNTQSQPGRAAPRAEDDRASSRRGLRGGTPGTSCAEPGLRALGGNATDRALMDAVLPFLTRPRGWGGRSSGGWDAPLSPEPGASAIRWQIPFDSARKHASVLLSRGRDSVLYVKGAPEVLLPSVVCCLGDDGQPAPFDRAAFARRVDAETRRGGRVILLCERVIPSGAPLPARGSAERGSWGELTLVCAVRLSDSLRREAPEAVRTLRRAGIHVVMITGDNKETARSIASSCGILAGRVQGVLDSGELALLTDDELRAALPTLGVVARALPTDKSRLVRAAQEADRVVGMTGDGINDAPALKRADIGFAMGDGTSVAKDAGDIIILDNDLSSITKAVLYGRTIFKSIRKFITLQLTMNLCAVGVTMLGPFLGVDAPVTVVQMLWINLIMDTLGGLAFAGEAPLPSYMKEPPKKRSEPILNRYMAGEVLYLGCFTILLCLAFLKLPFFTSHFRARPDGLCLLTAFFALFIFASVFNCFNARTDRLNPLAGLGRNRAFLGIMSAVLVVQLLFVYLGGPLLRTMPLTPAELSFTSLCALSVFPAEGLRKVIRRLWGRGGGY